MKKTRKHKRSLITKEEYIGLAKKNHGDKYDYSLLPDMLSLRKEKLKFICPIHGIMESLPRDHLRTCGCKQCGIDKLRIPIEKVSGDYIKRSKIKFKK